MGKDAQYVHCDGFWSMDFPFPVCKEPGESYYKNFYKYSVSLGAFCTICQIICKAIEKAGTLPQKRVEGVYRYVRKGKRTT
jgi:branched-chain amino acid transport system substrate-binding protein